ncbi:MAG: sigma-70 family RNA polymerase sigma factor [Bryobacteraceae bacterium]|jgi:RNA polymerase sigma-70 factor (ECF subfamily)
MTAGLTYAHLHSIAASGEQQRLTPEEAAAELFETARDDVYRYLLSLGLGPAQAQEATQEVFLRLYGVLRKGQRIANMRAWIFRVAHNYGLTLRGQERHWLPFDTELETRVPDQAGSPEQRLIDQERRTKLGNAVASLSPQQRQCLHLRTEGFRYREIAGILGISDSSVGEFLRRAIVRLRKALDG